MARGSRRDPKSWRERQRERQRSQAEPAPVPDEPTRAIPAFTPAVTATAANPVLAPEHPPGAPDVMAMFEQRLREAQQSMEKAMNAPDPNAPAQPRTANVLHVLHRDLSSIGTAIEHAWPLIRRLATSPQLVRLVEAGLRAEDINVNPDVLDAAATILESAAVKGEAAAQGTGPQPPLSVPGNGGSGEYPVTVFDGTGGVSATPQAQDEATQQMSADTAQPGPSGTNG